MLKRVKIKNFKNIAELEINVPKVCVIIGKNGQGKTAVLEAIKFLVHKDKGIEVIRKGATSCAVEIESSKGNVARRTMNKEGKGSLTLVNKITGEPIASPAKILQQVMPKFSLDPVSLALMDPKEQKKVVIEALEQKLQLTDKDYADMQIQPGQFQGTALQVVRQAYKYYYEQRRDANAEVKALKGVVSQGSGNVDINELNAKIVSLTKLAKDLKEYEEIIKEAERAKQQLALMHLSEEEEKRLNEIQERLAKLEKEREKREKKLKELEEYETKAKTLQEQINALLKEQNEVQAKINQLQKHKCPFDESLDCPVDFTEREAFKQEKERLEQIAKQIDELNKELKSLKKPRVPKDISEEFMELSNELAHLQSKKGNPELIAQLEAQIKKAEITESPARASYDEIMEELKQAEIERQTFQMYQESVAKLAQAEQKAKQLDALVKICKKKEEELLQRMQLPQGYQVDDNGISFKGVRFNVLSDKEKVVASIRLIKALFPQVDLFLIDGLEKFSKDVRDKLIPALEADPYQYIITCVADTPQEVASTLKSAIVMNQGVAQVINQ